MTIVLCSRAALTAAIEHHDPEIIISVVGRGEIVPSPTERYSVVHLALNDVQRDRGAWRAPTDRHVERLFDAVDGWSRSRPMLVHCHEGRSRAPAVVLGVMCRLGVDATDAVDCLRQAAPWVAPHAGFCRLVDATLGQGGQLMGAMSAEHTLTHGSLGDPGALRRSSAHVEAHYGLVESHR